MFRITQSPQSGLGSEPSISIHALDHFRCGPSAVCWPGIATILAPLTEGQLWVILYPVQAIVSEGISLKDSPTLLGTPQGLSMFDSRCKHIKMCKGELLFIPYGYVPSLTFLVPSADTKTKVKAAPQFMSVFSMPLFSTKFAKALPSHILTAIVEYNMKFLGRKGNDPTMARKQEFLKAFETSVAA